MADAEQANAWAADVQDIDLLGLGYTEEDIAALRDAAYAYGVLSQVFNGTTGLENPTDFRVSIRKLAGPG